MDKKKKKKPKKTTGFLGPEKFREFF